MRVRFFLAFEMKQLPQTTFVPDLKACSTWQDVCGFLDRSRGARPEVLAYSAQYAMALAARGAVGAARDFYAALAVANSLARAKAEIDIVSCHSREVVAETEAILRAAQDFLDEHTVPCTEWPLPQEIADEAVRIVMQRAPGPHKLKYFRKTCEPSGFPPQAIDLLEMSIEYSSANDILHIFEVLDAKPENRDSRTAWIADPGHCEIFGIKVFISYRERAVRILANPGSYDVIDVHFRNAESIEAKLAGSNLKMK